MGWGLVCEAHPHVRSCCTIVVPVKCRNQTPSCILYFSLISLCLSSHSQSLNQEGIFYATSSVVSPTQLTLLPLGMTATTHYAASTTLPVTLSLVALAPSSHPTCNLGGYFRRSSVASFLSPTSLSSTTSSTPPSPSISLCQDLQHLWL
jgi:hypothetical protein